MINSLEKTLYGCTLYIRGRWRLAAKGTGTASFSGLSRDKREMRATGEKRSATEHGHVPFLHCAPIFQSAERRLGTMHGRECSSEILN